MSRLEGRIAIVTGASGGIGRATAELFADNGATVYATDIVPPATALASPIRFMPHDVAMDDAWRELVRHVIGREGQIDILVNNAGIGGSMAPITDEELSSWHQVLAVNLTGPFLGMRAVLPHMRARNAGSIINISSIWGNAAVAYGAAYHATKGAIRQLTKHAAVVCGPDNVRINSVHPGVVATPPVLQGQSEEATNALLHASALGRMALPIELARAILFLASDDSAFMTGSELVVDGGYLAKGS